MLKYPNFAIEYNLIKPLETVEFILALEEHEQELKVWEAAKAGLNSKYGTEGSSLAVFLQDRILEELKEVTEEERKHGLAVQVERFRQVMKMPKDHGSRVRTASIVGELLRLYGSFSIEKFESDFNEIMEEEIKKVGDYDKEYARVNGHIGQYRRKINALWNDVSNCFQNDTLPTAFRNFTYTPNCSQKQVAEAMLRSFAKDWKNRCVYFDRPVTVHGVDIATLPSAMKDQWYQAWEKMKLGDSKKYPKRPMFFAVRSKTKDAEYLTPNPVELPGMFGDGK